MERGVGDTLQTQVYAKLFVISLCATRRPTMRTIIALAKQLRRRLEYAFNLTDNEYDRALSEHY
jgi:hypothetical protein